MCSHEINFLSELSNQGPRSFVRLICVAAAVFAGLATPVVGQPAMPPANTATPLLMRSVQSGGGGRSQFSGQVAAQHSPNVETVLKPEFKLVVERRHSQLVITRSNVRRLAVTDSTVCNYVQYSPTELAIVGLELGTTDLMIWFEGQPAPAIYEVTIIRDENLEEQRRAFFSRLERRLAELFPNSNVYLIPVGSQVLVKGQAFDPEEADQILQITRSEVIRSLNQFSGANGQDGATINNLFGSGGGQNQTQNGGAQFQDIIVNMLNVPGEYNIKMRVVIAEVSRSQLRELGVDWNVLFNDGRHGLGASLGGATGTTLSGIFQNGEISVLIKWLATNGTATLLAEPTIVCMSGHSASLLAGGEFAVPTIIGLGGGQNTSFRGVGTSMVVTPTVIDRDLIRLQIVPEFSAVDGNNSVNGIPGTTVKRIQTTVELREGQTLALGGLISRQMSTQINRIPLLGDIPYFGSRLFHSKNSSEDEVELLVLVTPEIVRPMEPDEVPPLPNYYITHPNDHDLYHYARSEGNPDTTVYQVSPFGTGQNHGMPSGYSLQSANVLPQYAAPGGDHMGSTTTLHPSQRLMPQPDSQMSGPYNGSAPQLMMPQQQPVPQQQAMPQPYLNAPPYSAPYSGPQQYPNPQQHSAPQYPNSQPYHSEPSVIPPAPVPNANSRIITPQPVNPPIPGNFQGAKTTPGFNGPARFRSPFEQARQTTQPGSYADSARQ